MWAIIVWFLYKTLQIRKRSGNNNKDYQWVFRQVLALATLVPVLVKFAYVWWEEPEEAMNGRLMNTVRNNQLSGSQKVRIGLIDCLFKPSSFL
jgi:hypothetical protein